MSRGSRSSANATGAAAPPRRDGDLVVLLPEPEPYQLPILLHPARFKVVCARRRWGKSVCALLAAVEGHGPEVGGHRGVLDGGEVWWVAPSYPIAMRNWRDLKHVFRGAWSAPNGKSEFEHRIVLPNGGSISVKSADNPDSLVGPGLDGVVFEEAARIPRAAWDESLRPTLSERNGWALFISSPKGTANWFHDLFQNAERLDGWARWQRPTSDNPRISADELGRAQRELGTLRFRQSYLAEFLAGSLGPFKRAWFRVVPERPQVTQAVRVWDLAGTVDGAYTAGVLMGRVPPSSGDIHGGWTVMHVVRGQWTPGTRDGVILQTAQADGRATRVLIEQEPGSGGIAQVDALKRMLAGWNVQAVAPTGDKVARAGPLASQAEVGRVSLVAGAWNSDFLDELEAFPEGDYLDQVDAAAHAFNALQAPIGVGGPPRIKGGTNGSTGRVFDGMAPR